MEQRVSLVTLGVSDLARARGFYEALGWSGAQQPDDEVCFFQAGGMVFGLWTALGGHGAPGIELAYNVRSPEEVTDVLNEAVLAGASIVRHAAVADWAGQLVRSPILTDTCGKWRIILAGRSTPMAPSTSRWLKSGEVGHTCRLLRHTAVTRSIPNSTTKEHCPKAPLTNSVRPSTALPGFPLRRPERQTRKADVGPLSAATRLMTTPGQAGGHGVNQAHTNTSPR